MNHHARVKYNFCKECIPTAFTINLRFVDLILKGNRRARPLVLNEGCSIVHSIRSTATDGAFRKRFRVTLTKDGPCFAS